MYFHDCKVFQIIMLPSENVQKNLKISILRQSCYSFCVHNLQETTFVCTIATYNFCLHYCNWKHFKHLLTFVCLIAIANVFYGTTTFVWTIASITINITLSQLLTFKCSMVKWKLFMHYCNWLLLFGLLQLRTIACCRSALTASVALITT